MATLHPCPTTIHARSVSPGATGQTLDALNRARLVFASRFDRAGKPIQP